MKSIAKEYQEEHNLYDVCLYVKLCKFEENHYKQKNELAEANEEIERLKFENHQKVLNHGTARHESFEARQENIVLKKENKSQARKIKTNYLKYKKLAKTMTKYAAENSRLLKGIDGEYGNDTLSKKYFDIHFRDMRDFDARLCSEIRVMESSSIDKQQQIKEQEGYMKKLELEYDLLRKNDSCKVEKLIGDIEVLEKELTRFQADDILSLIDISKRLNKTLKGSGEDEMIAQLMLERAKIMDHFTLAYLADTGFKPSQIKLVQGMNNRTEMFEMYFEKITTIIL